MAISPLSSAAHLLAKFDAAAFAYCAGPIGRLAARINAFVSIPDRFGVISKAPGPLMVFSFVVIAACIANSAIHNEAQPPMGSIMLKWAGIVLAVFTAYAAFGGTAAAVAAWGFGHTAANLTACLPAAYILYFTFSHP